jgi:hypothetical protein
MLRDNDNNRTFRLSPVDYFMFVLMRYVREGWLILSCLLITNFERCEHTYISYCEIISILFWPDDILYPKKSSREEARTYDVDDYIEEND